MKAVNLLLGFEDLLVVQLGFELWLLKVWRLGFELSLERGSFAIWDLKLSSLDG